MSLDLSTIKKLRELTGAGMGDVRQALMEAENDIEKATEILRKKGIAKAAKKQSRIAAEGLCNVLVNGDEALVYELNCETDFVAKNENFKILVDEIGGIVLHSAATNLEEALAVEIDGKSVDQLLVGATARIGEKINLRRVTRFTKNENSFFGAYVHMGGKKVALALVEGGNDVVAKDVSMHVAAIAPKYLDNSSISEEVKEHEKQILTAEALNEGKPPHIVEKMVIGRLNKYFKEVCLVNQPFIKDPDLTVMKYVKQNGGKVLDFLRLEVGEGIEKRQDDFAAEVLSQVKA